MRIKSSDRIPPLSDDRPLKQQFDNRTLSTVNTTFYGIPTIDTCTHWQQLVKGNASFHFTLKMRQTVTHGDTPGVPGRSSSPSRAHERSDRPFLEPLSTEALEAEMPPFLERCEQLRTGKKGEFSSSLGVVLLQFPPSFEKSMGTLSSCVRSCPDPFTHARTRTRKKKYCRGAGAFGTAFAGGRGRARH